MGREAAHYLEAAPQEGVPTVTIWVTKSSYVKGNDEMNTVVVAPRNLKVTLSLNEGGKFYYSQGSEGKEGKQGRGDEKGVTYVGKWLLLYGRH